jgi:hypothetical protein
MLEIAAFAGIDEVVILGDYGDFYSVSSHSRDPRLPHLLLEEVTSVREGLDELDRIFPEAKKVFLEGNHEYRLERYLVERAPALFGVTTTEGVLGIPQRPLWSFLSYGRNQSYRVLGTQLHARHTPLATNAKSSLQRAMISHCYGHVHRIEEVHARGLDGRSHVAFSPGWLGDPRLRPFDYLQSPDQWSCGFALVSCDDSVPEIFHHEIIRIKENFSAMYGGKEFRG